MENQCRSGAQPGARHPESSQCTPVLPVWRDSIPIGTINPNSSGPINNITKGKQSWAIRLVASSHLVNRAYKTPPTNKWEGGNRLPACSWESQARPHLPSVRGAWRTASSLSLTTQTQVSEHSLPLYHDLPPDAIDIKVFLQSTPRTSLLR